MIYRFNNKTPVIAEDSYVCDTAVIIGDVEIGPRTYVGPGAIIRGDAAKISIGAECAIEDGVIIHAGGGGCEHSVISDRVTIAHGAIVHSDYIGPSASIGVGAIVSVNSRIGAHTVVAEGALVKKGQQLESGIIVAGSPCKCLRKLADKDIEYWEKTKDWYVALTAEYIAQK